MNRAQDEAAIAGEITLAVKLDLEDVTLLQQEAKRALEIERALPAEARTALGSADDGSYIKDFIEKRATNDALEARGIIPIAAPRVHTNAGIIGTEPFTCYVDVYPRPEIGLTSLDPVDLATNRIAKPGFSLQAAREGSSDVEYLDDVKVLRIAMTERLDSQLSESAMRVLGREYEAKFERELFEHGNDPETFKATHQLDDEQYTIMLTRRALGDAHWNYALDAVFVGKGLTLGEEDILASFEADFPGCGDALLELHELRNDLYLEAEKVRRQQALDWLLENAIR